MKNTFEELYQMFIPANLPWNRNFPHFRLIDFLAEAEIKPCKVLEIGCGLGIDSIFLAKQGFEVTSIDISQTAIYQAHLKAQQENVNVDFWVSSALKLPFDDNSFDLVFDWRTFHCLQPADRCLYISEIKRVLRDHGGMLLAAFYLSGFKSEDKKISIRPVEKFPINEEIIEHLFNKEFKIEYFRVFDLDSKNSNWVGMFFLRKR